MLSTSKQGSGRARDLYFVSNCDPAVRLQPRRRCDLYWLDIRNRASPSRLDMSKTHIRLCAIRRRQESSARQSTADQRAPRKQRTQAECHPKLRCFSTKPKMPKRKRSRTRTIPIWRQADTALTATKLLVPKEEFGSGRTATTHTHHNITSAPHRQNPFPDPSWSVGPNPSIKMR